MCLMLTQIFSRFHARKDSNSKFHAIDFTLQKRQFPYSRGVSSEEESFFLDRSSLLTLNYKSISDPFEKLKNIRIKNPNRLVIVQFNRN